MQTDATQQSESNETQSNQTQSNETQPNETQSNPSEVDPDDEDSNVFSIAHETDRDVFKDSDLRAYEVKFQPFFLTYKLFGSRSDQPLAWLSMQPKKNTKLKTEVQSHMHTHACTYMHMHTHAYTCMHMHACAYICIYVHTYAYMCIHMHVCAYICIHVHMHTCTVWWRLIQELSEGGEHCQTPGQVGQGTSKPCRPSGGGHQDADHPGSYIHTYIHACIYAHMHTCIHLYMYS